MWSPCGASLRRRDEAESRRKVRLLLLWRRKLPLAGQHHGSGAELGVAEENCQNINLLVIVRSETIYNNAEIYLVQCSS